MKSGFFCLVDLRTIFYDNEVQKEGIFLSQIKKITCSALFLAIGFVLPFFTGQIPQIGSMLLPMHIPVFLCGLICGGPYGLVIGLILPVLRSMIFGMPPMFPTAVAMAFELATYGFVIGMVYSHAKWQCIKQLYIALLISMVAGRLVWAAVTCILVGLSNVNAMMLINGALVSAAPGIVVQLILIPLIMVTLDKAKVVPFKKSYTETKECIQ